MGVAKNEAAAGNQSSKGNVNFYELNPGINVSYGRVILTEQGGS